MTGSALEFDYVIVGGGTAGCVLAARLSEDPMVRVALIEAGPEDRHPFIHLPLGFGKLMGHPTYDWKFTTAPEAGCAGRVLDVPRGRVLGGSGSTNGLGFTRGHSSDFDTWAAQGAAGWSYRDVLPYFKRMEDYEGGEDEFRGAGGPLPVARSGERSPLTEAILDAAESIGVPRSLDVNGRDLEGGAYFQRNTRRGRRMSTAQAYLRPARKRANLAVLTDGLVDRLVIEGGKAGGVTLSRGGTLQTIRARRGVVLAAGTVGSPKILELSGIGDPAVLKAAGMPVFHALPGVGDNLQDHYVVRGVWELAGHPGYNARLRGSGLVREVLRYALRRDGLLAEPAACLNLFARTSPGVNLPDVELIATPWSIDRKRGFKPQPTPGMTLSSFQLRPDSRGSIHIASPDPAVQPVIQPNYLTAPADQDAAIAGLRLLRRMVDAAPLVPYRGRELTPGPDIDSDDELLAFAREAGISIYHLAGTCRMGSDPLAVVDPQLRVHGIDGLWVADASIMPMMVSAHTFAATVMIAEKAADLIRHAA